MAQGTPLIKHVWTTSVKDNVGTAIASGADTLLGTAEFNEKVTVTAGATAELDCGSIDKTKIVSVVIVSTKDLTVNTNAADATGGQSIALKAGLAWAWNEDLATANPVTQNITKIFAINAGTADATFTAAFLLNL